MEPIMQAIMAALPAMAPCAVSTVVSDAYNGLKAVLTRKFGSDSPSITALEKLEAQPDSADWQETLNDHLRKKAAEQDPEILSAANSLRKALGQPTIESSMVQGIVVTGDYNATADRGSTASVTINHYGSAPKP